MLIVVAALWTSGIHLLKNGNANGRKPVSCARIGPLECGLCGDSKSALAMAKKFHPYLSSIECIGDHCSASDLSPFVANKR